MFREVIMRLILILFIVLAGFQVPEARALLKLDKTSTSLKSQTASDATYLLPEQRREAAIHNAGNIMVPLSRGNINNAATDPETGEEVGATEYPAGSGVRQIFMGALWVGGIIGQDTLVSVAQDGWVQDQEILADDYPNGYIRTGNYADDEFEFSGTDTIPLGIYQSVGNDNPMGIKVLANSYSWADANYDDFLIIDYKIINIGDNNIENGWIGFLIDGDVYHDINQAQGFEDDLCGSLDTLLNPADPGSRVRLPYIIDNDGDPEENQSWTSTSAKGAVGINLLSSSFEVSQINFNWWISNGNTSLDFGPRRVGTPEDPYRNFYLSGLGTPVIDEDKYYILSHPEVDYDMMETAIHDSSDGWIPPYNQQIGIDWANGYDARYLYSFGSFDLAPGDTTTFAIALAGGNNIHVNPEDFSELFDADNPGVYYSTLDWSQLIANHLKADSVWKSGILLPRPGPPVGLQIDTFTADFISLNWYSSNRPDLDGYYLYYRDSLVDTAWHRAFASPQPDTEFVYSVGNREHRYQFAATIVTDDMRESGFSDIAEIIPATPYAPSGLNAEVLDKLPFLTWDIPVDPAVVQFRIYRSIWDGGYVLFDSTPASLYVDYDVESGVVYNYRITAVNDLGMESAFSDEVLAVPMNLNNEVLLANYNTESTPNLIAYKPEFLYRIFGDLESQTNAAIQNDFETPIDLKKLADYRWVIFDLESRLSYFTPDDVKYVRLYLENGGRVVFIMRNIFSTSTPLTGPRVVYYSAGNFYHDVLKLDSVMVNAIGDVYNLTGDLMGCGVLDAAYPGLAADSNKIDSSFALGVNGYIPFSGFLYPQDIATPIYSYQSTVPDTINNGQVNGIKYLGDDYQFVLFNFPLTLMEESANYDALYQALGELGLVLNCGDANSDGRTNVGDAVRLIFFIFVGGEEPDMAVSDINCDGAINVGDAVALINYVFKGGLLNCCPPENPFR